MPLKNVNLFINFDMNRALDYGKLWGRELLWLNTGLPNGNYHFGGG